MTDRPMDFAPRAGSCPLCDGVIFQWGTKSRLGQTYQYDRCKNCDFAFVNPRPTEAELARYYSGSSDSESAVQNSTLNPNAELGVWPKLAIAQMLGLRRGSGRFLDVGAGDGTFTIAAIQAGLKVAALELDHQDAARLRTLPGVEVSMVTFEQHPPVSGSYDYILMSHVLEHAYDARQWIEKSAQLLSPGGVLAIMLPHFNSIYRLLGGTRDRYFFPPEHLNHFSRRSLGQLCRRYGLIEEIVYTEGRFPADAVTRRVPMPRPLASLVQLATAGASLTVEKITGAAGVGGVLVFLARKPKE